MPDLSTPITIFTAVEYDAEAVRRKRTWLIVTAVVLLLAGVCCWHFRYLSYEMRTKRFFTAVQNKDYEKAFGIWNNDPEWQKHPQQYSLYKYGAFVLDWGPSGEYGLIHSFHIDSAEKPGRKGGSGVIVTVTINERSEPARLWIEKKDKKISFAPDTVY